MACLGPNAMFSTGEHSASMCTHRDSGFSSPSLQQLGSKSVKKKNPLGIRIESGWDVRCKSSFFELCVCQPLQIFNPSLEQCLPVPPPPPKPQLHDFNA